MGDEAGEYMRLLEDLKNFAKKYALFGLALVLVIFSVFYLVYLNSGELVHTAKKGYADLSSWDGSLVALDGQWEFYANQHLAPGEDFDSYSSSRSYMLVPGDWKYELSSSQGIGTYRLRIKLPGPGSYGFKTRTIRLASRLYVNGEEVLLTGEPDLDSFRPESRYELAFISSEGEDLELVFHVASFDYPSGGILRSIEFGDQASIIRRDRLDRGLDSFVVSICAVLGLYFLISFLNRREDIYLVYFSGACLFMSLYLSAMNEQLLHILLNYDFYTRIKIQLFSMVVVSFCVLSFTYHFFKDYLEGRLVNFLRFSLPWAIVLIFVDSLDNEISLFSNYVQPVFIALLVISYLYIFGALLKVLFLKVQDSEYISVIALCLGGYWITLIIKIVYEINLGFLPLVLISFMLLGVGLLMGSRHQRDYREIKSLSSKLISYSRLKDDFLSRVAVEIREPVERIDSLASLLAQGDRGPLNRDQQREVFFISQEGRRIRRLMTDLLSASSLEDSEGALEITAIDSQELVSELLREMSLLIEPKKSLRLVCDIPEEFPLIRGDRKRFTQIIYNLVDNALKFSQEGTIRVFAGLEAGRAVFGVQDQGYGISREDLKDVFDVFYQRDGLGQGGLGLGLALVKHLVEIQGGEISVSSSSEGTLFSFTAELYSGDGLDSRVSEEDFLGWALEDPARYRILVLDIDPDSRRVTKEVLGALGLEADFCHSSHRVADILRKKSYDLLIMDLVLEEGTSDSLLAKVRQSYSMGELPILLFSLAGSNMDLLRALEFGANELVNKPIHREELARKIASLLRIKDSLEESLKREFQYFTNQISPHFLHNTLNTIIGLSYEDDELARKALTNLSIYFRGKLDYFEDGRLIPLNKELELVRAYLEIEELRYGGRLRVYWDIDEGVSPRIPPLTLQPLVENALGHGLAKKPGGGSLKIISRRISQDQVELIIEDDGLGMDEKKKAELLEGRSNRVGFKNIKDKLKILSGASIRVDSELNRGTKITITLRNGGLNEGDSSR